MSRIPLTDDMRAKLRDEIERTGVGLTALFRETEGIPSSLNLPIARTWLYGPAKSADQENWLWLSEIYENLPSAPARTRKRRPHMDAATAHSSPYLRRKPKHSRTIYLEFTMEMHGNFVRELERTGAKLNTLANFCSCEGKRLTISVLSSWKHGNVKRVRAATWERVMKTLTRLPDAKPRSGGKKRTVIEPPRKSKKPYRPWRDEYIEITPRMRRQIQHHFSRTDVGVSELMKISEYPPAGLKPELIRAWKNGQTQSAESRLFNFTLNLLRSLPDKAGRK